MVDLARPRISDDMTQPDSSSFDAALEAHASELIGRVKRYARDRPIPFALWSFGIGFVLGWKLKPW